MTPMLPSPKVLVTTLTPAGNLSNFGVNHVLITVGPNFTPWEHVQLYFLILHIFKNQMRRTVGVTNSISYCSLQLTYN